VSGLHCYDTGDKIPKPQDQRSSMSAPQYLFTDYGNFPEEISDWCEENLQGAWCTIYDFRYKNHVIDFDLAIDLIHFKLRWVG